jgi:hypothetical protein
MDGKSVFWWQEKKYPIHYSFRVSLHNPDECAWSGVASRISRIMTILWPSPPGRMISLISSVKSVFFVTRC